MSKMKMLGTFICGALVGAVTAGYIIKNKYEEILEEEIQSVKDVYKNRTGVDEEIIARKEYRDSDLMENCDIEKIASTDDIKAYNENKGNVKKHDYGQYHKTGKAEDINECAEYNTQDVDPMLLPPTLIDEEEVGMHGYDMQVLTYYADSQLVDDTDTVVDIESYVGLDNIKLFHEHAGCETMFVRNEEKGVDYEIQRDDMTWSDFATQMGIDDLRSN